jgi:methanogenic corrinoid protein MtbC1
MFYGGIKEEARMPFTPKPDFERFMTALNCQEPDRVPLGDFYMDHSAKERFLGKKIVTLEDEVEFWHTAGFDFVTAPTGVIQGLLAQQAANPEAVMLSKVEGSERDWANEGEGFITTWEQFEKFPWPKVEDLDFSKWDTFGKIMPPGMKAMAILGRVYTQVWMMMGADVFYRSLETNEELIAAMFDKVGEIQYQTLLRLLEYPSVGAVVNPDDVAHNTGWLVNPKYFRKYIFPWYKKMGAECRNKGLGFIFHTDGDCTEAMEDIIDCGFHGLNPIQPNCMDIVEVKKKWGHRICLIGNINLDSTLTLGSPQDVRAEVYERIRTLAPGGGYMLASSNSIPDYVPLENMKAMLDATFEFGKYPIELEEGGVKGKIYTYSKKPKAKEASKPQTMDAGGYAEILVSGDESRVRDLVEKDLQTGHSLSDVVSKGLIPAMVKVGEQFQSGAVYIPEMILSAQTMASTLLHYKDQLTESGGKERGKVVIGTVWGDNHDVGKNLVIMLLEGHGYTVQDLGVSVSAEKFVQAVKESKPDILAMSALLTTTMVEMGKTIDVLTEAGLRDQVKIIVGGAPLTQDFADSIGADAYAYDAPGAAQICDDLVSR